MPKKQERGGGGNRKKGRSTRTPIRKMKHAERPARTEKNRLRKRLSHMKRQPNDLQTAKLLETPN